MKCEEVELCIIDYLDNNLEPVQKEEVEKHIQGCERCLDKLKDFKQILGTIESAGLEQPDENLRMNFYHALHDEIDKLPSQKVQSSISEGKVRRLSNHFLGIAAGIALLVSGAFIGMFINTVIGKQDEKAQIADLRIEVRNMKQLVVLSMLKEESPSQRIQAVGYTDEIQKPDKEVLNALVSTLNNDRNVNVRLAAAYSLARYADNQAVRDSLVESLTKETEPIVQVVLMNILVEKKESRAIKPMEQIISNKNTLKDVKEVAEKGIKVLL